MLRTIRRIQIRNLRSLRSIDFAPARVNLLVGPTGAGKTSVRAAVEYAISRRNQFTDGRGTGIQSQVSRGASGGSVILTYAGDDDDDVQASAEFPQETNRERRRALSLSYLGMSEVVLQCLVRGNFINLADAQRREILCEVLGVDVRHRSLARHLESWDPRFPDLLWWLNEQMSQHGWNGLDYEKYCRDHRIGCTRALKDADAQVALLRDRCLDADGQETAPAAVTDESLAAARNARDQVMQAIAAIEAGDAPARDAYAARLREWVSEKRRREDVLLAYQQAVVDLERARASCHLPPDRYRTSSELAEALAKVDAIVADLAESRAEASARRSSVASGPCPPGICLRQQQAEFDAAIDAIERDLEKQRGYQERYRQAIRRSEVYESSVAAADLRVRSAEAMLHQAEAARNSLAPEPPPRPEPPASRADEVDQLRADLAQADATIRDLEQARRTRETWEREYLQYQDASTRRVQLEEEAARWDSCVKAFEPRGLAARLASAAVGAWANEVDCSLALFGIRFRVVMDGEWFLEGRGRGDSDWIPASQLSGGEFLLLTAAVQVAIARRTGLACVFLDEVQAADAALRVQLVRWLLESGVQAFLFAAAQERANGSWARPRDPRMPGLAVWWVENGEITDVRDMEGQAA